VCSHRLDKRCNGKSRRGKDGAILRRREGSQRLKAAQTSARSGDVGYLQRHLGQASHHPASQAPLFLFCGVCGQMRLKAAWRVCFCCAPIGRSDVKSLAKRNGALDVDHLVHLARRSINFTYLRVNSTKLHIDWGTCK